MHPEGGSWTDVRTHTPIKFSKVRTEPLAPIPLDRSKFRENGSQPCPNPACDGHSNESIGDECVYCATNERQNTLYLWLHSTPFRSSLGDIGHGED